MAGCDSESIPDSGKDANRNRLGSGFDFTDRLLNFDWLIKSREFSRDRNILPPSPNDIRSIEPEIELSLLSDRKDDNDICENNDFLM